MLAMRAPSAWELPQAVQGPSSTLINLRKAFAAAAGMTLLAACGRRRRPCAAPLLTPGNGLGGSGNASARGHCTKVEVAGEYYGIVVGLVAWIGVAGAARWLVAAHCIALQRKALLSQRFILLRSRERAMVVHQLGHSRIFERSHVFFVMPTFLPQPFA